MLTDAELLELDVDVPVPAAVGNVLAEENAGDVTVSYFEWLQDIDCRSWSLERVNEELEAEVVDAWTDISEAYEEHDITWRDAAYIVVLANRRGTREPRIVALNCRSYPV